MKNTTNIYHFFIITPKKAKGNSMMAFFRRHVFPKSPLSFPEKVAVIWKFVPNRWRSPMGRISKQHKSYSNYGRQLCNRSF